MLLLSKKIALYMYFHDNDVASAFTPTTEENIGRRAVEVLYVLAEISVPN